MNFVNGPKELIQVLLELGLSISFPQLGVKFGSSFVRSTYRLVVYLFLSEIALEFFKVLRSCSLKST